LHPFGFTLERRITMSVQFRDNHPRIRRTAVPSLIPDADFLDMRDGNGVLTHIIYKGTIITSTIATGQPGVWNQFIFRAFIPSVNGRKWTKNQDPGPGWTIFDGGVALLVPASFHNARSAPCGWAVDEAIVTVEPGASTEGAENSLLLLAVVAVFDFDTKIERLSYQVTAVGRET
jgi:hypothetical protein